jgi:YjbE family integral membrane protein
MDLPLSDLLSPGAISAFFQVVMIDIALAGDNAVAVGLVAAGLPQPKRRRAILLGLAAAVIMRIGFALIAAQLMQLVGLLVAGGLLLLWVCWKMWRDLRAHGRENEAQGRAALEGGEHAVGKHAPRRAKTMGGALLQILAADLTMSLDNVLAVAGAAREHPFVLAAGILISITLMGVAASWIARLLHRFRWIGYLGLAIVVYVACHMIWQGSRTVAVDLGQIGRYNAAMPGRPLDISPDEAAKRRR